MKIKRLVKDIPLDKALGEIRSPNEEFGATDYQRIVNVIIRPSGDLWRIEISGTSNSYHSFEINEAFPLFSPDEQVVTFPHRYTVFNTFEEAQDYIQQGFERLRNAIDTKIIRERLAESEYKRIKELSKGFTFLYRTPQDTDSEIVEIKLL